MGSGGKLAKAGRMLTPRLYSTTGPSG